jgi:hypothetical protein
MRKITTMREEAQERIDEQNASIEAEKRKLKEERTLIDAKILENRALMSINESDDPDMLARLEQAH